MDREECENMMNIVVESRKRFGKMCIDYNYKASLMENKILNLNVETFSNYKFKPKQPIPSIEVKDYKHLEDFALQQTERVKMIDQLRQQVKNTQEVVLQLKTDTLGRLMKEPFTADFFLAKAKSKKEICK